MKLILGSGSEVRKLLLSSAGLDFEVMSPDVDELSIRSSDYKELTLLLARAKRDALLEKISEPSILITADTVAWIGDTLYEKPQSEEEMREFFKAYDGVTPIGFATGVTVTNTETGESKEAIESGELFLGPFDEEFIEHWIQKGTYMNYSGGFTYRENEFDPYQKELRGSLDALKGLPVELVLRYIEELS